MQFDELIDRYGTRCSKWDDMEAKYGVSPQDGIAMWVADMDFRPPDCVQNVVRQMAEHGIFGYHGNERAYVDAIVWWMQNRHNWAIDPSWIFTTHGLVNGTAICVDTFTKPGDGVVLFTPIYHSFFRILQTSDRDVIECPLALENGRYSLDFDRYDAMMRGHEKMLILSSPHNPGGRVWTPDELRAIGDFARRHDLIIVSDEIHHDLVYPGQKHTVFPLADDSVMDRLIVMSATTKTFNIAGSHVGSVIIPDSALRAKFKKRMAALGMSPNYFGLRMAEAAYSAEGAAWVDGLMAYLEGNHQLFDRAINALTGIKSMPLEATYLAWVDFSGTGMQPDEIKRRVQQEAQVAANHGETFGQGGEAFLRFNFATPRERVEIAIERLSQAFADLQ